jgi:hypothetical protein
MRQLSYLSGLDGLDDGVADCDGSCDLRDDGPPCLLHSGLCCPIDPLDDETDTVAIAIDNDKELLQDLAVAASRPPPGALPLPRCRRAIAHPVRRPRPRRPRRRPRPGVSSCPGGNGTAGPSSCAAALGQASLHFTRRLCRRRRRRRATGHAVWRPRRRRRRSSGVLLCPGGNGTEDPSSCAAALGDRARWARQASLHLTRRVIATLAAAAAAAAVQEPAGSPSSRQRQRRRQYRSPPAAGEPAGAAAAAAEEQAASSESVQQLRQHGDAAVAHGVRRVCHPVQQVRPTAIKKSTSRPSFQSGMPSNRHGLAWC